MPQRKSAKKSIKRDQKRRIRNLKIKKKVHKATKQYLQALKGNNLEEAKKALSLAYKEWDKAASKKYIHRNKTARKKSQLAKKLALLNKKES